jgi:PilZ domain-containing protein/sporulation related protein
MVRERRQAPRITVKGLAYVNLNRDNGGIILNISEGGLCFQATAPVQRTETVRVWFSYRSQLIESDLGHTSKNDAQTRAVPGFVETESELTWIDDTQKKGGLRFTKLPPDARKQIRDWIHQPSLVKISEKSAPSSTSSHRPPVLKNIVGLQPQTSAARGDSPELDSAAFEALFRNVRPVRLWSGFYRGLMAGVLASAIIVGLFFLLSHTRQLGDSLIQLGERLGGRTWAGAQDPRSPAPGLQPISPQPKNAAEVQTFAAVPVQVQTLQPKQLVSTVVPGDEPSEGQREAASHGTFPRSSPSVKVSGPMALNSTANKRLIRANKPLIPEFVVTPALEPSASMFAVTAPEMDPASRPGVHIEPSKAGGVGMNSEKYLEIGKFKEKLLADKTTGQLSQLGFPATVIQKHRLFGESYQVLVGPYESDPEAEAKHKKLTSLGFTPRSYERGKRDFRLPPALKVGGTHLPVGDCVISWESYPPNAIVKFEDITGTSVTVEGRWVNRSDMRYSSNAVVYFENRYGPRTLLEIRFDRMGQVLVFGRG